MVMAAYQLHGKLISLSTASGSQCSGKALRNVQVCRASKGRRQPIVEECISAPLQVSSWPVSYTHKAARVTL